MAASEGVTGPPAGLHSLLLVSHHIHSRVCVGNNARLYARLFQLKFDCSASRRRFPERWTTDRCLARELMKRFTALRRIKDQLYTLAIDDLWTCYLMFVCFTS